MRTTTARAAACSGMILFALTLPLTADTQGRGGQGQPAVTKAPQPTGERVRVKVGHANVHMGPTTVNEVIVLAPKGTVLSVLGRRGEWVQVGLSPALRKTGMVMRWYKSEDNGWIHDSLLEVVKPGAP
jgi:uncharacterized protein YgiM (DUF1202 family)